MSNISDLIDIVRNMQDVTESQIDEIYRLRERLAYCCGEPDTGETPDTGATCYLPDSSRWSTGRTTSEAYLGFYALSDGVINVNVFGNLFGREAFFYRYAAGQQPLPEPGDDPWVEIPNEETSVQIPVTAGQIVEFAGNLNYTSAYLYNQFDHIINFSGTTCSFNVYGNAFSLYDACCDWDVHDDDHNDISLKEFFKDCTTLKCAANLVLPGLELSQPGCYRSMFEGCTSLEQGPALPSEQVPEYGYERMFYGCTALTGAPSLDATSLNVGCYESMFELCTSLVALNDVLPAQEVPSYGYYHMFSECESLVYAPFIECERVCEAGCMEMFRDCTSLLSVRGFNPTYIESRGCNGMFMNCESLTTAPEIQFTGVDEYGCAYMFQDCHSLQNVPEELPCMYLSESCYTAMFENCVSLVTAPNIMAVGVDRESCASMFSGCINLTTPPEMNATSLAPYCYANMFYQCRSLVTTPELPSEYLDEGCYQYMFEECTSLQTMLDLPSTDIPDYAYQGMFKNCINLRNLSELPSEEVAYRGYYEMFAGCTSMVWAPDVAVRYVNEEACYAMFSGCTNLMATPDFNIVRTDVNACRRMFKDCTSLTTIGTGISNTVDYDYFEEHSFEEMFAGCTSLVKPFTDDIEFVSRDYGYVAMFSGCTSLTGITGSLNMDGNAGTYKQMFKDCTSLVVVPDLGGTNLAEYCYEEMFMNCTSLVWAPDLPANDAQEDCYKKMFYGCSSLNHIICLLTNFNNYDNCTGEWVYGVASTGIFEKVPDMYDWTTGQNGIPNGWTVIDN